MGVGIIGNQRQVIRWTTNSGKLRAFRFHFPGLSVVEEARIAGHHIFLTNVKHRGGEGSCIFRQQIFHPTLHLLTGGGPNIGLIGSLATFGRVNPFGFIETPYRKVVNGHVTDEVEYMTADRDLDHVIAQANQELDENGNFVQKSALARVGEEEAVDVPVSSVDYMDVSPRQMVSLGASLIPFLEHDEGHRALMGTNMQRQAVPLIESERPLVGTGSEWRAANDSGDVIKSEKDGVVTYVSADLIRVMNDDGTTSSYKLAKFQRSNQTTCYNQRPIVHDGERVEAGSVMADGPAIQNGDLALMPQKWPVR